MKFQKNKKVARFIRKTRFAFFVLDLLLLSFAIFCICVPDNIIVNYYLNYNFESYVEDYRDNSYILNITYKCKNATDMVECVWEEVPYDYNSERANFSLISLFRERGVLSPEEYFGSGGKGVCRDNAVMVKAILDNLNIDNHFTLEPNHVYITAYYNAKTYVINTYLKINGVRNDKV